VRPIQQAMPGALVELLRDAPLSPGKVTFAWRAAVGPAFDKVTSVRLEHGVLIVDAETRAWAYEVGRSKPIVLSRLQTLLGKTVVTDITVRARA
jgi:hypothetical protein